MLSAILTSLDARLDALGAGLHAAFTFRAQAAGAASASLGSVRDFDAARGNQAMWFLSPRRQVWETALLVLLLVPLARRLARTARPWAVSVPALPAAAVVAHHKAVADVFAGSRSRGVAGGLLLLLDLLLRAAAWLFLVLTVHYKSQVNESAEDGSDDGRTRVAYLLQPCHLFNLYLCLLSVDSIALGSTWAAPLFHFYLCTMYGAILAIATPDTTGLISGPNWDCAGAHRKSSTPCSFDTWRPFEVESFWAQHVVLLLLPCVWVARRRFPLYSGATLTLWTWAVSFLMHLVVFLPTGLVSGRNINYMTVPPGASGPRAAAAVAAVQAASAGKLDYEAAVAAAATAGELGLLAQFGDNYRLVMGVACIGLAFLTRNVIVEAVALLAGVLHDAAREAPLIAALAPADRALALRLSGVATGGGIGGAKARRSGQTRILAQLAASPGMSMAQELLKKESVEAVASGAGAVPLPSGGRRGAQDSPSPSPHPVHSARRGSLGTPAALAATPDEELEAVEAVDAVPAEHRSHMGAVLASLSLDAHRKRFSAVVGSILAFSPTRWAAGKRPAAAEAASMAVAAVPPVASGRRGSLGRVSPKAPAAVAAEAAAPLHAVSLRRAAAAAFPLGAAALASAMKVRADAAVLLPPSPDAPAPAAPAAVPRPPRAPGTPDLTVIGSPAPTTRGGVKITGSRHGPVGRATAASAAKARSVFSPTK